jgi:hypothetical protein
VRGGSEVSVTKAGAVIVIDRDTQHHDRLSDRDNGDIKTVDKINSGLPTSVADPITPLVAKKLSYLCPRVRLQRSAVV